MVYEVYSNVMINISKCNLLSALEGCKKGTLDNLMYVSHFRCKLALKTLNWVIGSSTVPALKHWRDKKFGLGGGDSSYWFRHSWNSNVSLKHPRLTIIDVCWNSWNYFRLWNVQNATLPVSFVKWGNKVEDKHSIDCEGRLLQIRSWNLMLNYYLTNQKLCRPQNIEIYY